MIKRPKNLKNYNILLSSKSKNELLDSSLLYDIPTQFNTPRYGTQFNTPRRGNPLWLPYSGGTV